MAYSAGNAAPPCDTDITPPQLTTGRNRSIILCKKDTNPVMPNDRKRDLLLKKWKSIEQNIAADSDHAYNLEWGTRRENFYNENGYIPCSSADMERLSLLKGV